MKTVRRLLGRRVVLVKASRNAAEECSQHLVDTPGSTYMPNKPKHPCGWPGCPNLTDKAYCPEHTKAANRRYEKYRRDPATRSRYGKTWQAARRKYKAKHPLCEMCLVEGKAVPMEQVHHIVPLSQGGTHDESNLMSVCKSCHSKIHAKEEDHWK